MPTIHLYLAMFGPKLTRKKKVLHLCLTSARNSTTGALRGFCVSHRCITGDEPNSLMHFPLMSREFTKVILFFCFWPSFNNVSNCGIFSFYDELSWHKGPMF